MSSNPRRATLLGAVIALMLLAAPAADAATARLSTSVANDAAQSIADRYADATDADESGVDGCHRQNRRAIAWDVFASISVDDDNAARVLGHGAGQLGEGAQDRAGGEPVALAVRELVAR